MSLEKRITTRELLRNFRKYKDELRTGTVHYLRVVIDNGEEITMTVQKKRNTGADIAKAMRALPHPIHIERTHIFDELLRPRHR